MHSICEGPWGCLEMIWGCEIMQKSYSAKLCKSVGWAFTRWASFKSGVHWVLTHWANYLEKPSFGAPVINSLDEQFVDGRECTFSLARWHVRWANGLVPDWMLTDLIWVFCRFSMNCWYVQWIDVWAREVVMFKEFQGKLLMMVLLVYVLI